MKKRVAGGVVILALALGASACGAPPAGSGATPGASGTPGATASDYVACLVSDVGGFNDKSFNQAAKAGVDQAVHELGITSNELESTSQADYAPYVATLQQKNCSIIIATGFNLEAAMVAAAKQDPGGHYAIVDDNPQNRPANLKPIVFKTSEAAFLAGYAAAAYSQSGTVGTWGGMPYPNVTIFMDGFADGVARYNQDDNKSVKLLGWNKKTQKGSFVNSFTDQSAAANVTQQLIAQGADVIMPVAGNAGLGALSVAQEKNAAVVWVDQDGYVAVSQYSGIMLTSVMKGIQAAVFDMIKQDASSSQFDASPYVGTLANQGVSIAPFHDFSTKLSQDVQSKIADLSQQIASGQLKVSSPADAAVGAAG